MTSPTTPPLVRLRDGVRRLADDDGAATAEYAITTMAMVVRIRHY